jgi:phenylpyruvate tautomerase PptA (4-oxalocrotonate tautomerase family)
MPLYTVTTQHGALTAQAKVKLAGELTAFHVDYSGIPKNWVHIVLPPAAASRPGRWRQRSR